MKSLRVMMCSGGAMHYHTAGKLSMKRTTRWALYVFPLLFPLAEAFALPMGYEQLRVTTATDGYTFLGDSTINNSGEIVYHKAYFSSAQLISTRRGALSGDLGSNLRFPDLNNLGELVYTNYSQGLRTFSRDKGELGYGVGAHINDLGFVAATSAGPGDQPYGIYQAGLYSPEGTWSPISVDPNALYIAQIVHLSNSGELIYIGATATGKSQLFSSTRGQLTALDSGVHYAMANNLGEFSYLVDDSLYWEDGTLISDGIVGGCTDMNDLRDIVCNHSMLFLDQPDPHFPPMYAGTFDTVLFTTRPLEYQTRDGFTIMVAEPASAAILAVGLLVFGAARSRKSVVRSARGQ